jgi:hypothetical protein
MRSGWSPGKICPPVAIKGLAAFPRSASCLTERYQHAPAPGIAELTHQTSATPGARASSDQIESSDRIKMLDSKVLEQL